MSGVNNVNITLLKQYQEEFSVEKDNFNNSTYNYFFTSYIPHCSDYYVEQMSKTLNGLYDKIKKGYYNINVWWIDYNNNIEEVENSLIDNGIKPEEIMDNFKDSNAGATAGAIAVGAAVAGGFASQAGADATGNVGTSQTNLNNMDTSATGATTSSNTQSLWSRFTNWVSNAAKDTGAWISNAWNTASNWVSEKATEVKDMSSNVLNSTGAFLSNAWNSITSWASEAYETINNALASVEASVNNAVISLSKGIVSLVESVGDLLLLAGAGIVSVGTLVVDGWNCVFNDQEGLVYTNLLWDDAKAAVSYNWTDKIYDALYATEFGQYLDEHAFGFFKSDGMGCQILEGVGYAAGVVGLSVVTFGTATPLVLGGTAAATGLSRYTAQEWNENSFTISYDGVNTMNIALDYNQYLDLENLNIGDSRDFTQTFLDEEGNQMDITFTVTKNGSNDYSVTDSYGNNPVFGGLNESNTAKGLALGAVYGLWEGLQYAVGAKIGTSTFNSITSNITNTAAQKLAVSGLRVASDTLTGVVEVPFQSAVTTLADGVSFSEAWEQNGGFTSVLTQAGIAGIGSVLGEAFDLNKVLRQNNSSSSETALSDLHGSATQEATIRRPSKLEQISNNIFGEPTRLSEVSASSNPNVTPEVLPNDVLIDSPRKRPTFTGSLPDDILYGPSKIYESSTSATPEVTIKELPSDLFDDPIKATTSSASNPNVTPEALPNDVLIDTPRKKPTFTGSLPDDILYGPSKIYESSTSSTPEVTIKELPSDLFDDPIKATTASSASNPNVTPQELPNDVLIDLSSSVGEVAMIKSAKDIVDEIFQASDSGSIIKNISVDDPNFKYVVSEVINRNDIGDAIEFLKGLSEKQYDYIIDYEIIPTDNGIGRFINSSIEIYKEGGIVAQTMYNNFFQLFREHGIKHSTAVAEYAYRLVKSLDGIDAEEALYAAFAHDYGMKGGLAYVNSKVFSILKKAGLDGLHLKDSVLSIYDLEQYRNNFDSDDAIDQIVRICHPLNSAITILSTENLLPSYINKDVVALLAMSHSKSTSGIGHFSLAEEWLEAVDILEKTVEFYNNQEGLGLIEMPTQITFDGDSIRQLINDPEQFLRLQEEAFAIRDSDAMADVVLAKDIGTAMQDGSYTVIVNNNPRKSYDDPVDSGKEVQNFSDLVYNNDGSPKISSDGKQIEITNSYSKGVHAGEMNVYFSSNRNGIEYVASASLKHPNQYPASSLSAIFERFGEVLTYTHIPDKRFELVLPKEAEGTQLASFYEMQIENYRNKNIKTIEDDFRDGKISEEIKENQINFLDNIKIVYK